MTSMLWFGLGLGIGICAAIGIMLLGQGMYVMNALKESVETQWEVVDPPAFPAFPVYKSEYQEMLSKPIVGSSPNTKKHLDTIDLLHQFIEQQKENVGGNGATDLKLVRIKKELKDRGIQFENVEYDGKAFEFFNINAETMAWGFDEIDAMELEEDDEEPI